MTFRIALLVLMTLLPPLGDAMAADKPNERLALVIGNAKYPDSDKPLKEPVGDARAVADELKRAGFEVDFGENLTGDAMRRAFDRLYGKIKPGSVTLVFFSGFGIQSNRQSFLIPVDAQIWTEADVRRDGLSLETLLGEINSRGAGVKIALLDASRRNPFERRFRSFSAGLAPVIAPSGSLVMYSAALSSVVTDNGGERSLFAGELLKEIGAPGLTAEEMLNRTRVNVTRASRSEQVPWISSSLAEDFAFAPAAKPDAESPPPPGPAAPPPQAAIVTPQPAQPPAPPVEATKRPPAIEPTKQAVAEPTKPAAPPPPPATEVKPPETALADDPTIKELSRKLADNPNDAAALYRRGQVYASKAAYPLALKDFDASIRINPRDVEAYNNRCWVRTVTGDLQKALRDCNEALRLRPNFVDALDSRGLLNLKNGQSKNAIADFDAALKINPKLTSSLYGRGLAKQRAGLTAEGELDITNAKAMDPNIVQEFAGYGVR
jgi:hypothetical protein